MDVDTVVLQGLVKSDGTLELDGKVPLPAGRVSVTLQQAPVAQGTETFIEMLRRVRALRERNGEKSDADAALALAMKMRDEFNEQVEELGRLQSEDRADAHLMR